MGYTFLFKYDNDEGSVVTLPISPETLITETGSNTKILSLISMGEASILKKPRLREYSFKFLLPKNSQLLEYPGDFKEPLYYLNKFRAFKENALPVRFIILRETMDGSEIFKTNLKVSFENYIVTENAGEEGDFWVELSLKEFRETEVTKVSLTSEGAVKEKLRTSKKENKEYVVKENDTLWKIAKLELGDGGRYSELISINGLENYKDIKAGDRLRLS